MVIKLLQIMLILQSLFSISTCITRSYKWSIEYDWINPDGVWRQAYVFKDLVTNEKHFPGPTIEIYQNDILSVNITNNLLTDTTSIHWHGLEQRMSPWMDGVPFITQYPILPGETFEYKIPIGDQYGTYWYHSHSGTQYTDGVYGLIIIHKYNDSINNIFNVNNETSLILTDWYHRSSHDIDAELKGKVWKSSIFFPDYESGLINGKSIFNCSYFLGISPLWINADKNLLKCEKGQYYNLEVEISKTYRIRILNAASGFTLRFSIDNHNLTIVAIDGIDIIPTTVQAINIYVAQRYDIILNTMNYNPKKNYWIRAVTLQNEGEILAILNYTGNNNIPNTKPYNNQIILSNNNNLRLFIPDKPPDANKNVTISLLCDREKWMCYANNISFQNPINPALLSSCEGKDPSNGNIFTQYFDINNQDIIDIIINNIGTQTHPIHLHGHHFWVLGTGKKNAGLFSNYSELNVIDPVKRDTIQINELSWLVLRFKADNPGTWLLHCHIEWHLSSGMLLFFNEIPNSIMDPPINFQNKINNIKCVTSSYQYNYLIIILILFLLVTVCILLILTSVYLWIRNKIKHNHDYNLVLADVHYN